MNMLKTTSGRNLGRQTIYMKSEQFNILSDFGGKKISPAGSRGWGPRGCGLALPSWPARKQVCCPIKSRPLSTAMKKTPWCRNPSPVSRPASSAPSHTTITALHIPPGIIQHHRTSVRLAPNETDLATSKAGVCSRSLRMTIRIC